MFYRRIVHKKNFADHFTRRHRGVKSGTFDAVSIAVDFLEVLHQSLRGQR